ncbi:hypothetical protein SDC9_126866 [bioreactor metagenome]|uniref:Uncharacterized protein n=1 Tax=bioreactor metagenome TaxID=1076179 RepID=A0A645CSF1_9ZZZZ
MVLQVVMVSSIQLPKMAINIPILETLQTVHSMVKEKKNLKINHFQLLL